VLLLGGRLRRSRLDEGRQQVVDQDDRADGRRQEGVRDQCRDEDGQRPHDLANDPVDRGRQVVARPPAAEDETSQGGRAVRRRQAGSLPHEAGAPWWSYESNTHRVRKETVMLNKILTLVALAALTV